MSLEKFNYKQLSSKELKELMGHNPKTDEEFDKSVRMVKLN